MVPMRLLSVGPRQPGPTGRPTRWASLSSAIVGHHDGVNVLGQPAVEHPTCLVHGLLGHGMSSLSHCGELLIGDVVHRGAGKRNQVARIAELLRVRIATRAGVAPAA